MHMSNLNDHKSNMLEFLLVLLPYILAYKPTIFS